MKKILWPIFLAVIFVLSGGLIGYAYWLYQVERGDEALVRGDSERAIEIYHDTTELFTKVPWLTHVLRNDYQKLTFNQVRAFYLKGDSDAAVERLAEGSARAPFIADTAEYAFWAGNILVRAALQSKNRTDSLDLLKEALEMYQKGLAVEPNDWDLKYNYELVRYLLSTRIKDEKKGEERAKSILEKMQPTRDPMRDNLPPEKRG